VHLTVAFLIIITTLISQMKEFGNEEERATTSGYRLFGKFIEVMQVVLYQGAIFYD
jgi:hypothetical protein